MFGNKLIEQFRSSLDERSRETLSKAAAKMVEAKMRGGKVMVVTAAAQTFTRASRH